MLAIVSISSISLSGTAQVEISFTANGSWGRNLHDSVQINFTKSLSQAIIGIKTKIITWAATPSGGSVTLVANDIWLSGLVDDQISGVRKTVDQATTSPTFVDCNDLVLTLAPSSHYKFKFMGAYTTAAAGTGLQLSVNGPVSPAFIRFVGQIASSPTAVLMGAGAAYDAAISGTASANATPLPFWIEGTISTGVAGGDFRLRFRSEINGSAVTILRGSFGELISV